MLVTVDSTTLRILCQKWRTQKLFMGVGSFSGIG